MLQTLTADAASQPRRAVSHLPLLLANGIGMASVYAFVALASPIAHLLHLKAWHVGGLFGVVGLVWMLLAAAWGRLADTRGRPATLRLAVMGFTASYVALAAYVWWALARGPAAVPPVALTLAAMFATRGAMGGFYAGIPVASMAWVADHATPDTRAAAMARMGAAGAVGMVLSPPMAGWLGRHDLALSLGLFALLPLLALPLLARLDGAAPAASPGRAVRLQPGDVRIRLPLAAAFSMYGSVMIANICLGFYLIDRLGQTAQNAAAWVGAALGSAGLALILAQTLVARRKGVAPALWMHWGALLGAAGFGATLLAPHPAAVCGAYFAAGLGLGMALPATSAEAANAVQPHEQGACAGAMSAAQGLALVVAPVIGTLIYGWNAAAPFALIAAVLALAGVAAWRARPKQR